MKNFSRTYIRQLEIGDQPHWLQVRHGLSLGLRKGKLKLVWLARLHSGSKYYYTTLGEDLDHDRAVRLALEWAKLGPSALSYRAVTERYLKDFALRKGSDTTTKATRSIYEKSLLPHWGDTLLSEITVEKINQWADSYVATIPKTGSYDLRARKASANRLLAALKAPLNWAFKKGLIDSDKGWRGAAKFRSVDIPRIRTISAFELSRLLIHCNQNFKEIIEAAALTGLRFSHLAAIRYEDIDVTARVVAIRRDKAGKLKYKRYAKDLDKYFSRKGTGYVFTKANGSPWVRGDQHHYLLRACKKAQLQRLTFHALRHSYASILVNRGVSLKRVAEDMLYENTRVLEKHYAHMESESLGDLVAENFHESDKTKV